MAKVILGVKRGFFGSWGLVNKKLKEIEKRGIRGRWEGFGTKKKNWPRALGDFGGVWWGRGA